MKKIFTLISMALVAMSVNAQEIWKAESLKDETAIKDEGQNHDWSVIKASAITKTENNAPNVVIHDPNDILPWPGKHQATDENGNLLWEKDDNGNEVPVYEPNKTDPSTVSNNGSAKLYNFTIQGNTENVAMTAICTPNLGETESWQGDPVHKVDNDPWDPTCGVKPAMGSWYEFAVAKNGVLKIGFFVNKNIQNNKLYFAELQADKSHYTLLDPTKLTVWGWTNNNTYADDNENTHKNTHPRADYCIVQAENLQNPFLGYVSFTAEAGKTYLFLSPNTQLGCYGFQFTAGGTDGIASVKTEQSADAPIYNLAGQKVDKGFKGVVIQNGKKMIQK